MVLFAPEFCPFLRLMYPAVGEDRAEEEAERCAYDASD
jgi:hypothetical protein